MPPSSMVRTRSHDDAAGEGARSAAANTSVDTYTASHRATGFWSPTTATLGRLDRPKPSADDTSPKHHRHTQVPRARNHRPFGQSLLIPNGAWFLLSRQPRRPGNEQGAG